MALKNKRQTGNDVARVDSAGRVALTVNINRSTKEWLRAASFEWRTTQGDILDRVLNNSVEQSAAKGKIVLVLTAAKF